MQKNTIAYWRWGVGRTRPVHRCQNQGECPAKSTESVTGEHREWQAGRQLRRSCWVWSLGAHAGPPWVVPIAGWGEWTAGVGHRPRKLSNELLIMMSRWPETVTNGMKDYFRAAQETCKAQTEGFKTNPSMCAAFACVLMVILLVLLNYR